MPYLGDVRNSSKFGNGKQRVITLDQLNEVDHKIPILGESAIESIGRIEKMFKAAEVIEVSEGVKFRAAQRGIDKRAPFHRERNGINDAILIELYADCVAHKANKGAGSPCLNPTGCIFVASGNLALLPYVV